MRIVGIDQGTTSTRALMVGADGDVAVVHAIEHQQIYPQDGWVEHDSEELIRNINACLEAAIETHGPLDAIGIDNQGESCLAWDGESKQALSPVIVWQDSRTLSEIDRLRSEGAEPRVLELAGLPLDPYFSAAKLGWIIKHIPAAQEALKRGTLRLGTTDAFFLDRLTGQFVTDITTASRTSLMSLDEGAWSAELCALFGVPMNCLPAIVPTTGAFGAIRTSAGMVPVTASITDQQAALYGFGCREPGDAKFTFGTGAFALMVTGGAIIRRPELGLLPTVAWQRDGEPPVYAVDGGVFTASAALNWAKELGLFTDFEAINRFDAPMAMARGLVFVPALAGLGCPHWAPQARGTWLGLSLEHKSADLVQAILEGVACRATEVVAAMDACLEKPGAGKGALPIDGGMSRNPYFAQCLADLTDRVIRPAMMAEMTGLGVLQLAAHPFGHNLETAIRFGEVHPEKAGRAWLEAFQTAIEISRKWNS